jgi:zinc protease
MPLFDIFSMVKKFEDVDSVRDDIYRTLEKYKTTPVDEKRLSDLKRRNRYQFLMGLDTPDHVAGGLARFVALTGGVEVVDQLYAQLNTITPQDIMSAARKYFVPENRTVVVVKGANE